MRTAPAISKTVASKHACVKVNTFDPTLVPNELATSLAPIPNANINATTNPHITNQNNSSAYGSIPQLFIQIKTPHRNTFYIQKEIFQHLSNYFNDNNFTLTTTFPNLANTFQSNNPLFNNQTNKKNTACTTKLYLIIAIRLNLLKYHK